MRLSLSEQFKIALIQMHCTPSPKENLRRAIKKVRKAATLGAKIVCLPELFQTQYFCQREDHDLFDLAEPIPGPSSEQLAAVAKSCKITLEASLFEKRARGVYHNTSVLFGPNGKICGLYRKMHIPDDPLYYEKFYFTPGDIGFHSFPTPHANLGMLVCWDQWFPEGARLTTLQGADVLIYPTAIGWHPSEKLRHGKSQHDAWRTIQRAHAIANGVYVASINRVGHEHGDIRGNKAKSGDGLEFWGGSFLCDPFGRIICEATHDKEEILIGYIDLGKIENIRRHWPFLRDRRVDAYAGITERFAE